MKTTLINFNRIKSSGLLLVFLLPLQVLAQISEYDPSTELHGSGEIVQISEILQAFESIEISQFPASVTVQVGGDQPSINLSLDDNLVSYLQFQVVSGVLKLSFKDPKNKPFWISKSTIRVLIGAPPLQSLTHKSNSTVTIDGIKGKTFKLINGANGNIMLKGKVNTFQLVSQANGQVNAQTLQADSASIITEANATIRVNARKIYEINQGHGTVDNVARRIP